MFSEDLSVFYNDADFARPFAKWSSTQEKITFNGIFSVVDEDTLRGYAVSAQFELSYASQDIDLKEGDILLDGAVVWGVRSDARRVNDGLQSVVLLSRTVFPTC